MSGTVEELLDLGKAHGLEERHRPALTGALDALQAARGKAEKREAARWRVVEDRVKRRVEASERVQVLEPFAVAVLEESREQEEFLLRYRYGRSSSMWAEEMERLITLEIIAERIGAERVEALRVDVTQKARRARRWEKAQARERRGTYERGAGPSGV